MSFIRNSKLVNNVVPADESNYTKGRYTAIDHITIHHAAAIATADQIAAIFQNPDRNGSAHYAIGIDCNVDQMVSEFSTAWSDSNWESNRSTISIEVSDNNIQNWTVSEACFRKLVLLVADIARRHKIKLIAGETLMWHRLYAATICPGDYLISRMEELAATANDIAACPDWSRDAVAWAYENGILKGTGESLALEDNVTREQMCVFLKRLYDLWQV